MKTVYALFAFVVLLIFSSCRSKVNVSFTTRSADTATIRKDMDIAPVIIYKTIRDFSRYVPVIMDEQKLHIISYPSPDDLYYNGKLAIPTLLNEGYLLDHRGINENVVFLTYTYEEYSKLNTAPTIQELLFSIKEKYPLSEFVECKTCINRESHDEINKLIDNGFPECRRVYFDVMMDKL